MRHLIGLPALLLGACAGEKPEHVYPTTDTATESVEWGSPALIRLNEVRGNAPAAVELYNTSSTATVDLSGWTLELRADCTATLGSTAQLGPAQHLLLWDEVNLKCGIDDNGAITLRADDGSTVDSTEWVVPFARHSWCRIPDGTGAFTVCSRFSPGNPNADREPSNQIAPTWTWSYDARAEALAPTADGTIWVGQPNGGLLTGLDRADGSETATIDLSSLPAGSLEEPGWRGVAALPDGRLVVASTHTAQILVVEPSSGASEVWLDTSSLGNPTFLLPHDDGSLTVSFLAEDTVVTLDADGTPLWTTTASDTIPLHGPTALTLVNGQLVAISSIHQTLVVLDPATGTFVGTISAPASESISDVEPGRMGSELKGIAWSETHQVLFVSERERGRIHGFDTSDMSTLLDDTRAWGFLGSAGWFGNEPDELGVPWVLAATPDDDVLVVTDVGNQRVTAYDLAGVVSALEP